ncbi:MAG: UPF0176 protein [Flavobacteriales bacterium]
MLEELRYTACKVEEVVSLAFKNYDCLINSILRGEEGFCAVGVLGNRRLLKTEFISPKRMPLRRHASQDQCPLFMTRFRIFVLIPARDCNAKTRITCNCTVMKQLHNQIDRKVLIERLKQSDEERMTLSFYQYAHINNPSFFRDYLYANWDEIQVYGRTYVSTEGINAQISLPTAQFENFKEHLFSISFMKGIRLNVAVEDDGKSFYKLKINIREKIVADGLNDKTFDVTNIGKHLSAAEFNELTSKDDTILIDMRNHYESEVGHFKGAITPDVDTFREEIEVVTELLEGKQDKNIVMYCTGGIRCEKASAWFKHQGYPNVHQLEGGIIEYTRQVNEYGLENRYIGKNFVFDERRGERISDDVIAVCHQCGATCDEHTNCSNMACNLLFIQCEKCKSAMNTCCSLDCKETYELPIETQKELRRGKLNSNKIFKKGRSEALKFKVSSKD